MSARVAVFVSGGGSNLQALLDRFVSRDAAARPASPEIALVVSDRAGAGALERARNAGVDTLTIAATDRAEDDVAAETLAALDQARVDLVVLAGYLKRIPARVVTRFAGRMLNIHPALLPSFGGQGMYGLRVHEAVIAAGCRVSGPTVHFVDEEYDRGPILAQWPVPVLIDDTPERLAARVLRAEHRLLPLCVEALARGAVSPGRVHDSSVFVLAQAGEEEGMRGVLGLGLGG